MQIAQALENDLRSRLREQKLDDIAEHVVQSAVECFALDFDAMDDYQEVGNTRLGGDPDLPGDFQWPCAGDPDVCERCFDDFLAQINFQDLPQLPSGSLLPEKGMFYLFAQEIGSAADPVVLDGFYYAGDLSKLQRTSHPDPDRACNQDYMNLHPVRVRAVPFVSLPWFQKAFRNGVGTGEDRYTRQIALLTALERENQIGQLLGFANAADEHSNLYRQLFLTRINKQELQFRDYWESMEEYEACIEMYRQQDDLGLVKNYESMRSEVSWLTENGEMIAKGAAQWRLLLQIESNIQMNFWVNDADPLYAFIQEVGLRGRDFSDIVGQVTQG